MAEITVAEQANSTTRVHGAKKTQNRIWEMICESVSWSRAAWQRTKYGTHWKWTGLKSDSGEQNVCHYARKTW